ncbi:MAG TPA: pseudouridine synthase, partial [Dehalococcoidia bacterium]|nr:pseudouridine synthase [Dehalococcoidia bacterium]
RAHQSLTRQLKERRVEKTYLALVDGLPRPAEGIIDAPIARHPLHRQKMAVVPGGREALTRYRVLEQIGDYCLLEAKPVTGRTHQIRVHLASIGHPIVGDSRYGRRSPFLERQFLHAHRLAFTLPADERRVEFVSPLPPDLEQALQLIRQGAKKW